MPSRITQAALTLRLYYEFIHFSTATNTPATLCTAFLVLYVSFRGADTTRHTVKYYPPICTLVVFIFLEYRCFFVLLSRSLADCSRARPVRYIMCITPPLSPSSLPFTLAPSLFSLLFSLFRQTTFLRFWKIEKQQYSVRSARLLVKWSMYNNLVQFSFYNIEYISGRLKNLSSKSACGCSWVSSETKT